MISLRSLFGGVIMQVPVQVTIRQIPHSPAVLEHIRNKSYRLNHFAEYMIACHVVVELVSRHQQQGNQYNTRIVATVPGRELVSTHNHSENMYVSIRDAFDDMLRQLENSMAKMRGQVKVHPLLLEGVVDRLFEADYGFIQGDDGEEYYFNAGNVRHRFGQLREGIHVHFIPFLGDEGWQAHRVGVHRRDEAKAA